MKLAVVRLHLSMNLVIDNGDVLNLAGLGLLHELRVRDFRVFSIPPDFWKTCHRRTRQAKMNTQKIIVLTVEFTK